MIGCAATAEVVVEVGAEAEMDAVVVVVGGGMENFRIGSGEAAAKDSGRRTGESAEALTTELESWELWDVGGDEMGAEARS